MRICIYMKSGNAIELRGVKDVKVSAQGNEIVSLTIKRTWLATHILNMPRLVMPSINLSQIEAITVA